MFGPKFRVEMVEDRDTGTRCNVESRSKWCHIYSDDRHGRRIPTTLPFYVHTDSRLFWSLIRPRPSPVVDGLVTSSESEVGATSQISAYKTLVDDTRFGVRPVKSEKHDGITPPRVVVDSPIHSVYNQEWVRRRLRL